MGGKFGLGFGDGGKVLKQGFLKDKDREKNCKKKRGLFRKTEKMGGATKEKREKLQRAKRAQKDLLLLVLLSSLQTF